MIRALQFLLMVLAVTGPAVAEDVTYCEKTFSGEISQTSVVLFIEAMEVSSCEAATKLRVTIYSPGGDPQAAMALYDWLQAHNADTVALGEISSAAVTVFLAGEHRTAFPNSVFLIHPGSVFMHGDYTDRDRAEIDAMDDWDEDHYKQTIVNRTRLSRQEVDQMFEHFDLFGAKEALEWGFLTK